MTFREKLGLVFTLGATLLLSSCGTTIQLANQLISQNRAQTQGPGADSLVQVARAYAQGHHSTSAPSAALPAVDPSADGAEQEQQYKSQIALDLVNKNYDALEKEAGADLSPTARFAGGSWRVFGYYEELSAPPAPDTASDAAWNAQIDAIKAWVAARPNSSAARIALAAVYDNWGQKARGGGYADTVSDDGWRVYNERLAMTAKTLVDAAKLPEKSPYWFSVMFDVALAQGWEKSQAKALLDAAISFEPSYYHAYRQYANFIAPKWYGEEGDAQAFTEQISTQIGGEEGDFVYFELASTLACGCDVEQDRAHLQSLSWPRIKSGYAAMEHLYGHSSLKTNRFAYMSVLETDKQSAQAAFAVIGNNPSPDTWPSQTYFLQSKAWAEYPGGQ
jgi:hypothetical protein